MREAGQVVELDWAWSDHRSWDLLSFRVTVAAWDAERGRFTGEELVSDDGMENAEAFPAAGEVRGEFSFQAPARGLYRFRIEVVASNYLVDGRGRGTGHGTTWRAWLEEKVLVGPGGWRVVPLRAAGSAWDPRESRFGFAYELYYGPSLSRDCDLRYFVGWPAGVLGHECDEESGQRTLRLANPHPGTSGSWRLTFAFDPDAPPFADIPVSAGFHASSDIGG